MARMHTRKRGKSGSKKPSTRISPEWVEYSAYEVEDMIEKFGRSGMGATAIGMLLRDTYGVPSVKNLCGKSITKIMEERGIKIDYPEDLVYLIKRAVRMRKHLEQNKSDIHNRTKLRHIESKIRRLVKYYRSTKRLPFDWTYDPKTASLLVR
ncbi:MAG: 30S ribosomal protein S15 [Candidatus Anstonellales archaeon]